MSRPKGQTLTPQDILDVAIILLETQGVEGFSINQLARALAIKPPSLYNHFAGDGDLRRSMRLVGWRKMSAYCLPDIQSNDHPIELIHRIAQSCRKFALENRALYLFTIQHPFPTRDPEFNLLLESTFDLYQTVLIPFGLGQKELEHAVQMLYASVHGFLINELQGVFNSDEQTTESFNWMIDRLVTSLFLSTHPNP